MTRLPLFLLTITVVIATGPTPTSAQSAPFVIIESDAFNSRWTSAEQANAALNGLLEPYLEELEQPIPEVLSVWTTFPMFGNNSGTNYIPIANTVTGLGLEDEVFEDTGGVNESPLPPLRAILLHNNIDVSGGATRHGAPVEGYARYLFLLELSHLWGPALRVPGDVPNELLGFSFHWSFYNDLPSPAGGSRWENLGEGRYRAAPLAPGEIAFSMLDLYTMGLVPASEVPPTGVLRNVTGAEDIFDPIWGRRGLQARTFPWMNVDQEVIVNAERVEYTIEEIIEANGPRTPAYGDESTEISIGFVLLVPSGTADEARSALLEEHAGLFDSLVDGYADATGARGSLSVVTSTDLASSVPDGGTPDPSDAGSDAGTLDAGVDAGDAGIDDEDADMGGGTMSDDGGCNVSTAAGPNALAFVWVLLALRRRS